MLVWANTVWLMGHVGHQKPGLSFARHGTPCPSFMLVVTEQETGGKAHATLIPREGWSQKAEAAGALDAGAPWRASKAMHGPHLLAKHRRRLQAQQQCEQTWKRRQSHPYPYEDWQQALMAWPQQERMPRDFMVW